MALRFTLQPFGAARLGDVLLQSLAEPIWSEFRASIAFVKRSGTKHVINSLRAFGLRGGTIRMSAGIDAGGTSREGLEDLLSAVGATGQLYVFKNANSSTFHPKVYLFRNQVAARLLIGSGNLTEGGLYTNYEAGVAIELDLRLAEDTAFLREVETALDAWSTPTAGNCVLLDSVLLSRLASEGWVPDEAYTRGGNQNFAGGSASTGNSLFTAFPVPQAPVIAPSGSGVTGAQNRTGFFGPAPVFSNPAGNPTPLPGAVTAQHRVFLMTLQNTDVGVGQTSPNTQRRSAEVFVPLICRDYDPAFWGWPNLFVADPGYMGARDSDGRGKMDRTGVRLNINGNIVTVTIWYNSGKRDMRIRSEDLRSAGLVGDILYVEASSDPSYDYYVNVIPQGTSQHGTYLALCVNTVRSSLKRWAYL
ncbi:phospholipase D family protein [Paraburkholderia ferrariae]|uniref:Phospholipase D family protein n=1 Tax=Paraburkholderia ferrariae TaxID=386056 RepID=A0ABU9S1B2_9BURK